MTEPAAQVRKRFRSRKYSAAPLAEPEDEASLGPAMRLLSPRLRKFVRELAVGPVGYGSEVRAARAAGLGTATSSDASMKALTHQAMHNPKVQDALREVGAKIIRAESFQLIKNVLTIASDLRNPQALKANLALLDRAGFSVETVHHVEVTNRHEIVVPVAEVLARIKVLAAAAGLEPASLPPIIDGKDVTP